MGARRNAHRGSAAKQNGTSLQGFMEGGAEEGRRAAREVLAAFR
jgi:hypothetical protein